jgi:hypothetical protein
MVFGINRKNKDRTPSNRLKNKKNIIPLSILKNRKFVASMLFGFFLFGLKELASLIYQPLQVIIALMGLVLVFISPFFYNIKANCPLKGSIKPLYYLFLFWTLMLILRPLITGHSYSANSINPFYSHGIASFIIPLIVFIDIKISSINLIFKAVSAFAFVGFIYFIINYNNMMVVIATGVLQGFDGELGINGLADNYDMWFAASTFSLLSLEFLPKKQKWFIVFSNAFILFLMLFFARRTGVFVYGLFFMGMFYLYAIRSKGIKRMNNIFLILLIVIASIYIFMSYSDSVFSLLFDRLVDDTRSGVDIAAIDYLNKENAWIIGNGIEAAYSYSGFAEPRYVHETGYIYLILKGGIIYLSLYIILLLHAFYKGFFKTNNRFTKGMALYMLFNVIFLIPFGLPSFSLYYLLVWISFALCENHKLRYLSDKQLIHYLRINNSL